MKYSPTVTLALALAAGIAGAAAAQTEATPGAASNSPQTAAPTMSAVPNNGEPQAVTQPRATYGQSQPNAAQAQPNVAQPQPNYTQTAPSSPAGAGMPTRSASMQNSAPDQVRSAQEQLQAAGLYNGPVDGRMDPDTRAAIARFQQQNGMRRTETLDRTTLDRLMANRTTGSGSGAPATSPVAPNPTQGTTPAPSGAGEGTTEPSTAR
jgi:Putative peptidoglycan binding domain